MTEDRETTGAEVSNVGNGDGAEDVKLDADWDENFEVTVRATCPKCGRVTEIKARDAVPDKEIPCACGDFKIVIGNDSLRDFQRAADDMRRTAENLFK